MLCYKTLQNSGATINHEYNGGNFVNQVSFPKNYIICVTVLICSGTNPSGISLTYYGSGTEEAFGMRSFNQGYYIGKVYLNVKNGDRAVAGGNFSSMSYRNISSCCIY